MIGEKEIEHKRKGGREIGRQKESQRERRVIQKSD
jgi:hypothetical protein